MKFSTLPHCMTRRESLLVPGAVWLEGQASRGPEPKDGKA